MKSKSFAGLVLLWCKLNPPLLPYSSGKVEGALSAAVHTELFTSLSILLTCRTCHLPVQCLPNRFRCCGITLYSLHKNHDREREIWEIQQNSAINRLRRYKNCKTCPMLKTSQNRHRPTAVQLVSLGIVGEVRLHAALNSRI